MATTTSFEARVGEIRRRIDRVDAAVVRLLARRFALVKRVGALKKAAGKPLADPKREASVLSRARAMAKTAGAPPDAVARIFSSVFAEAKKIENRLKE